MSSLPQVKVRSDPTPRDDWKWLGIGIAFIGLLSALPLPKKKPDEFWPRRPPPNRVKDKPILLMHSPLDVDREQTLRMLNAFGRNWPAAEIRWPRSSALLLEALRCAPKEQHSLNLKHQSAEHFLKNAGRVIVEAERGRARNASRLSGLVRRCAFLDDDALTTLIQRFLVLANYDAHRLVQWTMNQARDIGVEFAMPKSWEIFIGDHFRVLYDTEGARAWQGQLVSINGRQVVGKSGPGLWVYGPRYVFAHRRMMDRSWLGLIAQIECASPDENELPPTYEGEWHFACYRPHAGSGSGLGGDTDELVKTDHQIQAELARFTEKWEASGKAREIW